MEREPMDASKDPERPHAVNHSVAWCDPRLCQPDVTGRAGRWHYAIGAAIVLTLHDEAHLAGELKRPTLHVVADQHDVHEPTYCLYSELAKASSRSEHRGMDLALTRQEAGRLRDELSKWLDITS